MYGRNQNSRPAHQKTQIHHGYKNYTNIDINVLKTTQKNQFVYVKSSLYTSLNMLLIVCKYIHMYMAYSTYMYILHSLSILYARRTSSGQNMNFKRHKTILRENRSMQFDIEYLIGVITKRRINSRPNAFTANTVNIEKVTRIIQLGLPYYFFYLNIHVYEVHANYENMYSQ